MEHIWIEDNTFKISKKIGKLSPSEKHICKTCGCKRFTTIIRKYKYYGYVRNMQIYGSEQPQCIDYELEKSKIID